MCFSKQHNGTANMNNNDPKLYSWGILQRGLLRHHNGAKKIGSTKALTQDQVDRLYAAGFNI